MVNAKTCSALLVVLGLLACHAAPVEVARSPISSLAKTLRLVRTYSNPFVWIGTPTLPAWATRRRDEVVRKPARKRYRWAIEIDGKSARSTTAPPTNRTKTRSGQSMVDHRVRERPQQPESCGGYDRPASRLAVLEPSL